jgi:cytochrome c biogenesis protein CcdA
VNPLARRKGQEPQLSSDELYNQYVDRQLQDAVAGAKTQLAAADTFGDKRVTVAAITAAVTGGVAVLGAAADGLETLAPFELDWVLTTAAVVLVAIGLVLFVVFRVTRLSKQETEHLRTALNMVLDAANQQFKNPPAG